MTTLSSIGKGRTKNNGHFTGRSTYVYVLSPLSIQVIFFERYALRPKKQFLVSETWRLSLTATLAQIKKLRVVFTTTFELNNIRNTPDNAGTLVSQSILRLIPLLSDVDVEFLRSILVLTPNGKFFRLCHFCFQWAIRCLSGTSRDCRNIGASTIDCVDLRNTNPKFPGLRYLNDGHWAVHF